MELVLQVESSVTKLYNAGLHDFAKSYPIIVPDNQIVIIDGLRMTDGGTLLLKEKDLNNCNVFIQANIEGLLCLIIDLSKEMEETLENQQTDTL